MRRAAGGWWEAEASAPAGDHLFSYLVAGERWVPDYAAHGIRANRFVQRYGERLMPALYEVYNPMPYDGAAEMEVAACPAPKKIPSSGWRKRGVKGLSIGSRPKMPEPPRT